MQCHVCQHPKGMQWHGGPIKEALCLRGASTQQVGCTQAPGLCIMGVALNRSHHHSSSGRGDVLARQ